MEAGNAVGTCDHGCQVGDGGVEGGEVVVDAAVAEGRDSEPIVVLESARGWRELVVVGVSRGRRRIEYGL